MNKNSLLLVKSFQGFFHFILILTLIFGWTACQEPIEKEIPIGDDGQVFAIDVKDSEIPYLVISTDGRQIPFEPKIPATLKVYEKKKLTRSNLYVLNLEERHPLGCLIKRVSIWKQLINQEILLKYLFLECLNWTIGA